MKKYGFPALKRIPATMDDPVADVFIESARKLVNIPKAM